MTTPADPESGLTEAEADAKALRVQALRVQALCLLVAWQVMERADRLGFWAREIVALLGTDVEVVTEARRVSFKEGY